MHFTTVRRYAVVADRNQRNERHSAECSYLGVLWSEPTTRGSRLSRHRNRTARVFERANVTYDEVKDYYLHRQWISNRWTIALVPLDG